VLFSAMKNEAPFLLEWIAYHKAIGFDEIVICSNPSNDGTEELLVALGEAAQVTHIRSLPVHGRSAQQLASIAFSQQCGYRDGDWYLWLDADEFLNVHTGDRTVGALVAAIGSQQCALVNWRIFGANGNETFPGRFVSADFVGASAEGFAGNDQVKTLYHHSKNFRGFARFGIHRPLVARNTDLRLDDVLVGTGATASDAYRMHLRWLKGVDSGGTARVADGELGWALAQINHYMVRTPDFFALKRNRGRGYKPDAVGGANLRHTPEFFETNDRNEAEDRTILHWQDAVTAGIERLLANPAVAAASARSAMLVKDIMANPESPSAPAVAEPADDPAKPSEPVFELTFPAAESAYVRETYPKARVILEYGSGGSTVLAAEAGCRVMSVESDRAWAERLADHLAAISSRASVHHADIGPTGAWGTPLKANAYAKFPSYALSVWDRPDFEEPDLVLIDGRFRASCLVAVLLRAKRPTTVLFDDYAKRRYYHGVERLARKEEMVGRMARFTVTPGAIPPEMVTQAIGWFTDPR